MASQNTSPTVLGLSECWNERVKAEIKGFLSEIGEKLAVVCTILDDKIEESAEQDASKNEVFLIHGKRKKYSNPRLDPPSPVWLLNYENYYPEIRVLQNVKYIIGLSQLTEPAANEIHHTLFPDAKLYFLEENPGALFVFDSWNKRSCSLRAFHRVLIKDLSARKKEKLDVYTTVLATDSDISECQKTDAQNSCVTLITAKRNPWVTESEDRANMLWLMNYQCYYPELKTLTNIRYVIGYAPKTGRAAAEIKKNLFPDAKLVLINHRYTDLDGNMLELASEADILFSIGPKLHEDLNNAYRGGYDEISLTEIPHEEILPKPSELNKKCAKLSKTTNRRYVLTYPWKMESEEQLSRCEKITAAITSVVNREKGFFHTPLKWTIFGSTKEKENEIISHLAMKLKQGCIKPTFVKGSSRDEIRTGLKQSHICLITAWDEEYGFDGLEAMALGVPFLAPDHEQIAEFIRKHFDLCFEHCVVRNNENWGEKILQVLHTHLEASFRRAEGFKQDFKESEDVLESYTRFAAFLPTEKGKDNVQEATAKDGKFYY
ncbi:uncharacterized protein [Ptychodera flava]|uniref:uncharacterized protein n=1 Tax=Ptychodera flava TaxID=63121 RepID=UPI00396AB033